MSILMPQRLVERPWGRTELPAPFAATGGQRIGEVWFEPFRDFAQLLVKYIFTSEALSVQVHPSDAQLAGHGKDECWLILDADPGARIGIGLREPADEAAVRAAALDGTIEAMLAWFPAKAGDFFYVPAGTIHAIGAGLSLIEVQQNSDTTYRLYDYGRDRPLHLDEGLAVARLEPHAASMRTSLADVGHVPLVDGRSFRLDRICGAPDAGNAARYAEGPLLVIPLGQAVEVEGEAVEPGNCAMAPRIGEVRVPAEGLCLIAQPCTP